MIDKLSKYGPSIFSTMTGLALEHGALNLAQGFPDFPTDPKLITCVDHAMKDGYNQYSRPMGTVNLHKQIETLVFNNYGREVNGDEEFESKVNEIMDHFHKSDTKKKELREDENGTQLKRIRLKQTIISYHIALSKHYDELNISGSTTTGGVKTAFVD